MQYKNLHVYYVDKNLITKESDVLASILDSMFNKDLNWEESQLNHITLKDTKHVVLEAFFAYCYTGYIPMSSINQDLAHFTEKYNVTNLILRRPYCININWIE